MSNLFYYASPYTQTTRKFYCNYGDLCYMKRGFVCIRACVLAHASQACIHRRMKFKSQPPNQPSFMSK